MCEGACLNLNQAGKSRTRPERWKAELTWVVGYTDSLPVCRLLPVQALTGHGIEEFRFMTLMMLKTVACKRVRAVVDSSGNCNRGHRYMQLVCYIDMSS